MKNKHQRQTKQPQEKPLPERKGAAIDSFVNQLARLGMAGPNITAASQYPLTRLTRDYNLMNALYRNSWICKKVINAIPDDMTKNWYSDTAELTPEQTDRMNKLEQRTLVREKITEGLYWGRLYGGAGAVMMIKGHENMLEEPLDFDDIMPNSFCGLLVLDRWSGIYPSTEIVTDIDDPEFGLPEYYEIRNDAAGQVQQRIHHSRVIRFIGRLLPYWENMAEMGWGAAELEHVFEEMVKRDNTSWGAAALVHKAAVWINKINGFSQMQAMSDPQMQTDLYNVKSAQAQMINNNGMMVIGEDEAMELHTYTFSGLDKVLEMQMYDVSGASEIPITRLFGRSPAGLDASGEGDLQNYYDLIAQKQGTELTPKINKLRPVLYMSELGFVPDDMGVKWNPVRTPSDEKIAELVAKKVTAISEAFKGGLISQKIGLTELHELSFTTNMFTSITDKDIEKADESLDSGDMFGDLGMGGGLGGPGGGFGKKPGDEKKPGGEKDDKASDS